MAVREIKGWSQICALPRQPDYMRGVLNLRGVMVPIVDLRCRFGQGMTEATPLHIIMVVQSTTGRSGCSPTAFWISSTSNLRRFSRSPASPRWPESTSSPAW